MTDQEAHSLNAASVEAALALRPIASSQVGKLHCLLVNGAELGLRRYDAVLVAFETNDGARLTLPDYSQNLSLLASMYSDEAKDSGVLSVGVILCVRNLSEWHEIPTCHDQHPWIVPLSAVQLNAGKFDPSSLRTAIAKPENLPRLDPFASTQPCRQSMFFGRKRTLAQVLDKPWQSCAVVGPSRIGKTSLLRAIRRQLSHYQQTFVEIPMLGAPTFSEFRRSLHQRIAGTHWFKEDYRHDLQIDRLLMRTASKLGTRFVIAIDEFDSFAAADQGTLESLRSLVSSERLHGRCRFIVAGYSALWDAIENPRSPLFNLFQPVVLGPFDEDEAKSFVSTTLDELGIPDASSPLAVAEIVRMTGRLPWLLQHFCSEVLLHYSQRGCGSLAKWSEEIAASPETEYSVFSNLSAEVGSLQLAIVHSLAENDALDLISFRGHLQDHGMMVTPEEIMVHVRRLIQLGVVTKEPSGLKLSSPILERRLQSTLSAEEAIQILKQERNPLAMNSKPTGQESKTTNITNVYGNVSESQFQQSGERSQQAAGPANDFSKLKEALDELRRNLDALTRDSETKRELEAEAECIEAQIRSPKPKKRTIEESTKTIRSVLEGMTGSLLANALWQKLTGL